MRISSFAMELRTNVLVHGAYTYLYVYGDVPSKRRFSFTWYLSGCACMGQTGKVANGVLACGHICRQGAAAPPAALGADSIAALVSEELHVVAAWWS